MELCSVWCFFTFYHGKSPLNHHLGEYFWNFFQPPEGNLRKSVTLPCAGSVFFADRIGGWLPSKKKQGVGFQTICPDAQGIDYLLTLLGCPRQLVNGW